MYLLFTNWVQGPYLEIQAQGFSYGPGFARAVWKTKGLHFLVRYEHPVSK